MLSKKGFVTVYDYGTIVCVGFSVGLTSILLSPPKAHRIKMATVASQPANSNLIMSTPVLLYKLDVDGA